MGRSTKEILANLTAPEAQVLEKARAGLAAGLSENDPQHDEGWQDSHVIRGDFLSALLKNPDLFEINQDQVLIGGAWVKGNVDLSHATIPIVVRLETCRFSDPIDLSYAKSQTISFRGSTIKVLVATTLRVDGTLFLSSATLGHKPGENNAEKMQVDANRDLAFIAGGLSVRDNLDLDDMIAYGEFNIIAAHVGGQFSCNGTVLFNDNQERRPALAADGVRIDSGAFFGLSKEEVLDDGSSRPFIASGQVRFTGAEIKGSLTFNGSEVEGDLFLDQASISGNLNFVNNFKCQGSILLPNTTIGMGLLCQNSSFVCNPKDSAFSSFAAFIAKDSAVAGTFSWINIEQCQGIIDFRNMKVGSFRDDEVSWKELAFLRLEGFKYNNMERYGSSAERILWLKRAPISRKPSFYPQPYRQLEIALREAGLYREARKIGIARHDSYRDHLRDRAKKENQGFWLRRAWLFFAKHSIAYGYEPWRIFAPIFFIYIINTGGFWDAYSLGAMRPSKEIIYTHDCYFPEPPGDPGVEHNPDICGDWTTFAFQRTNAEIRLPKDYPAFNAYAYSLDTFIPFVDLHQESYWIPDEDRPYGWFVKHLLWFHILAGWFFATIGIAGLTGVVKKSDGD